MTVVRALRVLQVEDIGQVVPLVIGLGEILLFERTIRRRALSRVVHPADEVIVIGLFTFTAQVRRECPALLLPAFAHRVARHTAARFERLFAFFGITGLLLRQRALQ